ncbi:transposase [Rhodococcus sp. ABRD24]|uniref:transposase n=1 Tax=Rhodococcus sp. ABRD24 TaxID=2507582 RepID=UPI0013F17D0B|nr:transposase [Rhodococcus sp. ABRD24]
MNALSVPGSGLDEPEPDDQKRYRLRRGSRGGCRVGFDTAKYKGRNIVEQSSATFGQWRGLASRYDELGPTYRAGVVLSAVRIWLRSLDE